MLDNTKQKFTPGPWKVFRNEIMVADGPNVGMPLATVAQFVPAHRAKSDANARLIAAAPDLLAALAEVMGWVKEWEPAFVFDDEWPETAARIKAAIAKAEG